LEDRFTLPIYQNVRLPLTLARGVGTMVYDEQGNGYLDLYGGHAVCSIGHSHPRWVREMTDQIGKLTFYSNAAYSTVRAEAAEQLVTHSYDSMHGVFFCNSGAEANETALKIARKATGRSHIVSMNGGFHGRTIGALSATGFPRMRERFPDNLDMFTRFVDLGDTSLFAMSDPERIAAVILEPIQSVSGVFMAEPEYYRSLRDFCSRNGIVLIFDEVQTGTGRTGEWYAGLNWGVAPDIVTTAKGVGGGISAGVVMTTEAVAGTIEPGDQASTFGGNPVAAAGIRATYRIIEEYGLVERVRSTSRTVVSRLRALGGVREVRGLGYLLGVECDMPSRELQRRLFDERILVGECAHAHTIRLLPPLTVTMDEWEQFLDVFEKIVADTPNGNSGRRDR
jgi:acetylornithine aminotransferase/acetylornithine/N-succinyldiaminopimelate aminotransferase